MYFSAGGKGIHRPLDRNLEKGRINKQMKKNKIQNEAQGYYNKNKGKKSNGNVRPFSYTDFKSYGASNKKKRKRN